MIVPLLKGLALTLRTFFTRPITAVMLGVGLVLLALGMRSIFVRAARAHASLDLEAVAGRGRESNP